MGMANWLQRWFKQSEKDPWIIQSPSTRTPKELEEFNLWRSGGLAKERLFELGRALEFHRMGIHSEFKIHTFSGQGAEGIFFNPPIHWTESDSRYFYDWIAFVAIALGYTEAHSEFKTNWVTPQTGNREFKYLKPKRTQHHQDTIPQLFGNLIVERCIVFDKTTWVKLVSQHYQGRPYQEVQPFSEFLEQLLSFPFQED